MCARGRKSRRGGIEKYAPSSSTKGEKTISERATSWKAQAYALLDVRPELEQGGEAFVSIMAAAAAIKSGETLVIIAPFESAPLYEVLEAHSFAHAMENLVADE